MWIEKRKDKFYAYERYYDDIVGKYKRLSVQINKDSPQERKKAQKALDAKWNEMHLSMDNLRLSDIGKLYFEDASDRLKEQTLIRDKGQFKIVSKLLENALIDNLKASWIKAKLKASAKANTTLNSYIKIFKIVMRWAYQNEYTDNIQCVDRLQKFPDRTEREKIQDKFLNTEDLQKLIDGMDCEHHKMLTRLLALTGMRIGEAIGLNDSDVDMFNKTITINKTYVHMLQKTDTPKTLDSIRTIPIQKELFALVNDIRKWSNERRLLTGQRNNIFFTSPEGKYICYDVYEKYLRENSKRILGRKITAHVLRHTFTSIMSEKGLSLDQISRQLGHSDSKITKEIYMHITDGQKQKDAAAIAEIKIFATNLPQ